MKLAIEVSQQELFNIYNRINKLYKNRFELIPWSIHNAPPKRIQELSGVNRWILSNLLDPLHLRAIYNKDSSDENKFVLIGNEVQSGYFKINDAAADILFTGSSDNFNCLGIERPIDKFSIRKEERNKKFACNAIAFTNSLQQATVPADIVSCAVSQGVRLFGNIKVNHPNYLGDVDARQAASLVSSSNVCIDFTGNECLFYFLSGAKQILVLGANFHTVNDLEKILLNPSKFFESEEYKHWYINYTKEVEKNTYDTLIQSTLNFLEY